MRINTAIGGINLVFDTGNYYFSPKNIDAGTLQMLNSVEIYETDKVLDLGCGYGVVGVYAAKKIGGGNVAMSDVLPEAVELSKKNLELNGITDVRVIESDGLKNIGDGDFTLILSNPPYHTDFSVAKGFIEDGFKKLALGGRLVLVTKRCDWYKNKITSVFGGVKVIEAGDYFVFVGEKRKNHVEKAVKKKNTLSKKLQRKYGKRFGGTGEKPEETCCGKETK